MPRGSLLPKLGCAAVAGLLLLPGPALSSSAPDSTFGVSGRSISHISLLGGQEESTLGDYTEDMTIDAQGRIVVVGLSTQELSWDPEAFVARFTEAGQLDPSFSGDGYARIGWSSASDAAYGVVIDHHGRIVIGGEATTSDYADFAAARYLTNGEADPTFGGDGRVTYDFPAAGYDHGHAVAVDAADRVLVAGTAIQASLDEYVGLVRFTEAGSVDKTFGKEGAVLTGFPGAGFSRGEAIAVDAAGGTLVAGSTAISSNSFFTVVRFDAAGNLDYGFGENAWARLDFGLDEGESPYDMTIDANGRIVLVGSATQSHGRVTDLGRLLPSGTPDFQFDEDGRVTTADSGYFYGNRVAIDRAGRIVVSGGMGNLFGKDAFLARYSDSGVFDSSLGPEGFLREDFLAALAYGQGVAIDGAGRYVLAGTATPAETPASIGLARFVVDYPPPPAAPAPPASLRCGGRMVTEVGTQKGETLRGTHASDVIAGLGGNDSIRGLAGNDFICAGSGRDRVKGGVGRDYIWGEGAPDRLYGGAGADRLHGQEGADRIVGGPGDDRLDGGKGRDRVSP